MADSPLSTTQPDPLTVLDNSAKLPADPVAMRALGVKLSAKFTQYENDRKLAELKWARNARQYLGIYDPEIDSTIDKNRSRAYPKLTRVKCVSMLSRLMNLLFQADDKNWTIEPSPMPNLDTADLQQILDSIAPPPAPAQTMGAPGALPQPPASDEITDAQIELAIYEFAKKRAQKLERLVDDQLKELGGNKMADYVALCRQVLNSGIRYGCGVLSGPFVEEQQLRTWQKDATGRMVAVARTAYRPRFEFIPLWEYYPDMAAKLLPQMEGQFLRRVMSKHQVIALKKRADFDAKQIDEALRTTPEGNYQRKAFETELRTMGVQNNAQDNLRGKYEVIIWYGHATGRDLKACGVDVEEDQMEDDLVAELWQIGNVIIKAMLNPWTSLNTNGEVKQFHHFIFEEDESFLLGNGLPNIVRDSQMGVCAGTRITLDNASVGRVFELNMGLLKPGQDITAINPDKIFYREDTDPSTMQVPAIRTIELPSKLQENQAIVRMFQEFADQETFVNAATGGDMQRGPSEPFRTATGASMLRGDAALPFKDVVRSFDAFTESVIGAIINFNRVFNPDPSMRGDFDPVARGATSLIAKEVLGMQLDNLAVTVTEEEKRYLKPLQLLRERVRVRDMVVDEIVMTDEEAKQADEAAQQSQMAQQDLATRTMEAEIKAILAKATKELAQAGKNQAGAQATSAGVVTDAIQLGLDQQNVEADRGSAGNAGTGGTPPKVD